MGQHAILSASASKRWMNCTPSALLEKQFADEESIYAAEGTAAHALAEHKLKRFLKKRSKRPVSDYDCDEMEECTDDYVSFAMEQMHRKNGNSSRRTASVTWMWKKVSGRNCISFRYRNLRWHFTVWIRKLMTGEF